MSRGAIMARRSGAATIPVQRDSRQGVGREGRRLSQEGDEAAGHLEPTPSLIGNPLVFVEIGSTYKPVGFSWMDAEIEFSSILAACGDPKVWANKVWGTARIKIAIR